ncbi:MAG: hypothetical protein MK077_07545 [Phycisphaerales bacterium]|nr:hypothetical protein [Phycisphaerales bacterium]
MSLARRLCLLVLYGSLVLLIPWSGCCCVGWPAPEINEGTQGVAMFDLESPYLVVQVGCTAAGLFAGVLLLSGVVLLHKGQLRNAAVTEAARRAGWSLVVGWTAVTVLLTLGLLWRLLGTAMAEAVPVDWPVLGTTAIFLIWIGLVLFCGAVLRREPPATPWDEPRGSARNQAG